MNRKLAASEYPKGELLRIQHELDQAGVPRTVNIGFNPHLPDGDCVADRVTWLIRQAKSLTQSREGLKTRIGKMDAIIRKQWHELNPNGKCICGDCDINGCRPDCDPCFNALPQYVKNLLQTERNYLKNKEE